MKKKTIISFVFLCTVFYAQAQINKGRAFIGGSFDLWGQSKDYENNTSSNYKSTNLWFGSSLNFLVSDNLGLGFSLNYGLNNSTWKHPNWNSSSHENQYSIGINMSNFKMFNDKFGFIFTNSLGVGFGNSRNYSENNGQNVTTKYNTLNFELNGRPGFIYFLNSKVAVQATIGSFYLGLKKAKPSSDNVVNSDNSESLTYGINFNSIGLGLNYFLK